MFTLSLCISFPLNQKDLATLYCTSQHHLEPSPDRVDFCPLRKPLSFLTVLHLISLIHSHRLPGPTLPLLINSFQLNTRGGGSFQIQIALH